MPASGTRELWLLDPAPIMGGGQAFALKLARYASREGRVVRIACPAETGLATHATQAGIPLEPLALPDLHPRSSPAIVGAVLATRRLLAAARPGVLVVANHPRAHAYVSAAAVALRRRPPVVLIAHDQESAARPSARFVYRRFGALVVVGANAAATYERALPGVAIRRVNNFLLLSDGEGRAPPPDRASPALGVIARMIPEKGILELVDELAANPDAWSELRIAAPLQDPRYVERVRERISARGLSARVQLLGGVADVSRFLATIDVVVAPSVGTEAQPTTILEALERGRPVVARSRLWSRDFDSLPVVPYEDGHDLGHAIARARALPVPPWSELAERFGPRQALEGIETAGLADRTR